ncbi:MAG: hypothetical protein LBL58_19055 [Tannerellaceae bacterium]|jgi:hypothetical protein|nr:hypothetical protein [Tannerellaceae bacterium]
MKRKYLCILLLCIGQGVYAQLVELEHEIVGTFFEPLKTKIIKANYMDSAREEGMLYEYVSRRGNEEFNLIYYGYEHRLNDSVDSSIIEVYGQQFHYPGDLRGHGDFHLFEHNNKKYVLWIDQDYMSYVWNSDYFLFDITDKERVTFLRFEKFTFDSTSAEIGLYPKENGKLCTIITAWDSGHGAYRTRLYCIEDGRLDEVLDTEGRNIELFFKWNKWEYEIITIIEKNIPESITIEELSFRTVDYFLDAATQREVYLKEGEAERNQLRMYYPLIVDNQSDDKERTEPASSEEESPGQKTALQEVPVLAESQEPEGIDETERTVSDTTKGFSHLLIGIGVLLPIIGLVLFIMHKKRTGNEYTR